MKNHLRRDGAGLQPDGPCREVRLWREGGPNDAPTWEELKVDGWEASGTTITQVGIGHGDVLVVQEHPNRLPRGLPTAIEWFRVQQSQR